MNYKIYQLKDLSKYGFMSYEFAAEHEFNLNDYELTYSGKIDERDGLVLDQIYYQLNNNHPKNYKGHSLSVSDLVVISNGDTYYVDSFGFKYIGTGVIK